MRLTNYGKTLFSVDNNDIAPDGTFSFPEGITSIGNSAFQGCINLRTLVIPSSVTSIEHYTFADCINLDSLIIPDGVTSIGNSAFQGCFNLKILILPKNLQSIGLTVFDGCINLKALIFPESVMSSNKLSFYDCASLQTVTLPKNITWISNSAFFGCINLKKLTLPSSITSIEKSAFYGCTGLHTLILSNTIKSIGEGAFFNCTNLQVLTLPGSIQSIGNKAFFGCTNLRLIIDSENEAQKENIISLLSEDDKKRVISKTLVLEIISQQEKQLAKLVQTPQTNPLYRFFNPDTRFESQVRVDNKTGQNIDMACRKLPNDLFQHINYQLGNYNSYYQKAKNLMAREPWPKMGELEAYTKRLVAIVDDCIEQAIQFTQPKSNNPSNLAPQEEAINSSLALS